VRQDSDPMSHHTHAMEGRLSIEEHVVSIVQLSFRNGPNSNKMLNFFFFVFIEVDKVGIPFAYLRLDYEFHFAFQAEVKDPLVVELINLFREGQASCNFLWHSEFVQSDVRIGADHTSG